MAMPLIVVGLGRDVVVLHQEEGRPGVEQAVTQRDLMRFPTGCPPGAERVAALVLGWSGGLNTLE